MVTETYPKPTFLPTYLCDSIVSSDRSDSSDSSDSRESSDSNDSSDSSDSSASCDKKKLFSPETFYQQKNVHQFYFPIFFHTKQENFTKEKVHNFLFVHKNLF